MSRRGGMFGTVLQRTLLDTWDNLLLAFVGNFLVATVSFFCVVAVARLGPFSPVLATIAAGVAAVLCGLLVLAFAAVLDTSVRERMFSLRAGAAAIRNHALPMAVFVSSSMALLAGIATLAAFLPATGDVAFGIAVVLIVVLAFGWLQFAVLFVPLLANADSATEAASKAGLLVAHNPGFTSLVALIALVFLASTFVGVPGLAGVLILGSAAARLRLLRYEVNDSDAPDWDELLRDERKLLSGLTLTRIVFPWRR